MDLKKKRSFYIFSSTNAMDSFYYKVAAFKSIIAVTTYRYWKIIGQCIDNFCNIMHGPLLLDRTVCRTLYSMWPSFGYFSIVIYRISANSKFLIHQPLLGGINHLKIDYIKCLSHHCNIFFLFSISEFSM